MIRALIAAAATGAASEADTLDNDDVTFEPYEYITEYDMEGALA